MNLETIAVILISIAVGASGQIAYLFIVDHEMVRTSKAKLKELQKRAFHLYFRRILLLSVSQ